MPLSVFLMDKPNETPIERFERFNRQLIRAISACSLCPKGCKLHNHNHIDRDPHYPQSIWHKNIALLKYKPDHSDINGKIFDGIKSTLAKYNLTLDDFYTTSIIKCPNHGAISNFQCPYWKLELQAINPVQPALWIVFDESSANDLSQTYRLGKFDQLNENTKVFFTNTNHPSFEAILKMIINPRLRKRLCPS